MDSIDGYTAAYLADYVYFVERDGDEGWEIQIQAPGSPVYKVHHIGTVCQEPNSIVLENAQTGQLTRLSTDDATMAIFTRCAVVRWTLGKSEDQDQDATAPSNVVPKMLATARGPGRPSPTPKMSVPSITLHDRDFIKSLGIEPNLKVDKS
jgi:hypothetical protein